MSNRSRRNGKNSVIMVNGIYFWDFWLKVSCVNWMLANLLRLKPNGPFNGVFKWNSSVLTIKKPGLKVVVNLRYATRQIMHGMVSSQLSEDVGDFWRFFSLCFCIENVAFCAGGSGTKKHLRPGDASQHQIFIRGGFQEIFWLCHRLVKVSLFGWWPHISAF